MDALLKARRVYSADQVSPRSFELDLINHIEQPQGVVIRRSDIFIMARPVNIFSSSGKICDSAVVFPLEQSNCWHVWSAALDQATIDDFIKFCPFPLDYISWERRDKLRYYDFGFWLKRLERQYEWIATN